MYVVSTYIGIYTYNIYIFVGIYIGIYIDEVSI